MRVLEEGLGILQWTATARPNSKNRALAARTRRLVVKAHEAIARLPVPPSGVNDFLTELDNAPQPVQFPSSSFTLDIPVPSSTQTQEWGSSAELDTLQAMPVAPAGNDDQFDAWLAMLFPTGNEPAEDWMVSPNGWPQ